jgi:hypothetical protein
MDYILPVYTERERARELRHMHKMLYKQIQKKYDQNKGLQEHTSQLLKRLSDLLPDLCFNPFLP